MGNDTILGINPWKSDKGFVGIASKWAGAQFSVIMSGFVTYPFDTVRRRLQMQSEKPLNERMYKNALDCAQKNLEGRRFCCYVQGCWCQCSPWYWCCSRLGHLRRIASYGCSSKLNYISYFLLIY